MIGIIKKIVKDTILEEPARDFYFRVTRNKSYAIDLQTFAVMKSILKKNSNCIDVGAHKGWILKKILKFSPHGKHLAFEPIPHLFKKLKQKFPSVEIYENALSDKEGESIFHFLENLSAYSGLKERPYSIPNPSIKKIQVKTQTLDNILKKNPRKIDFIKIDVEGAEGLVIDGGLKTIERYKPFIVFEYGSSAAKCYGTKPEKIYDLLCSESGLKISLMKDWIDGKKSLSLDEFKKQYYDKINFYFLAHT